MTITDDQWHEQYNPLDAPDGSMVWQFDEVKDKDPHHVWSWMDGDFGGTFVAPGFHVVNVYGYAVTEKPWEHEDIQVDMEDDDYHRAIEEIALILWYDNEKREWDRDKEWNADTIEAVAEALRDRGLDPFSDEDAT